MDKWAEGKSPLSRTRAYRIWMNIRNTDTPVQWGDHKSFIAYVERLYNYEAHGYVFTRIDMSLPYQPGNVKFMKRSEQNARRVFGTGVGIRKRGNKYAARIVINKREVTIGSFDSFDEAVQKRKEYIHEFMLPHRIK